MDINQLDIIDEQLSENYKLKMTNQKVLKTKI